MSIKLSPNFVQSLARGLTVIEAMGASRGSLVRQLVMEASALAVIARAAGILAAYGGVRALLWLAPRDLPRLDVLQLEIGRHLKRQIERSRRVFFVDGRREDARLDVDRHRIEIVRRR